MKCSSIDNISSNNSELSELQHCPKTTTVTQLMQMEFTEPEPIVENLLSRPCLAILSAPIRAGKSYLAVQLALDVAGGTPFLNLETFQEKVLYMALEDTHKRMVERLRRQLKDGETIPDQVIFQFGTGSLTAIDDLEAKLQGQDAPKLVVIDSLAMIPRNETSRWNANYQIASDLKTLAYKYNVCILLTIHDPHKTHSDDPFREVMDVSSLVNTADCIMVMTHDDHSDAETMLHIAGRDVGNQTYALSFDQDGCIWKLVDNYDSQAIQ